MLFQNWYASGVKQLSSHAHKTGSWYLLEDLFKISSDHPPYIPAWGGGGRKGVMAGQKIDCY